LANVVANPENTIFKIISIIEYPTMLVSDSFIGTSAEFYDGFEKAGHQKGQKAAEQAEAQIRSLFSNLSLSITAEVLNGSPQGVLIEKAQI